MKTIGNKTLVEMLPQIKKVAKKHNLKTYKLKDFKKIMKILGIFLLLVSCTKQNKNKRLLNETIDTVQDMKIWMLQDREDGIINEEYADYYVEYLTETEQNLIKIHHDL